MEFTIDLNAKPEPLDVKVGSGGFRIHHDYLTSDERAQALSFLGIPAMGMAACLDMLYKKFTNWEGVKDGNNAPIPIKVVNSADKKETSNVDKVMGRVPWIEQIKLAIQQFALNGVTLAKLFDTFEPYVPNNDELKQIVQGLEDFYKRVTATGSAPSPA